MAQGSRPARVGEAIRQALSEIIAREVHDPGMGFLTLTRVQVSPDLQVARVFYTQLGDDAAKKATRRALDRAMPFLRHQVGQQVKLRRVPELHFTFDQSVEHQDRIEKILLDLQREREALSAAQDAPGTEHAAPSTEHPSTSTSTSTSTEHADEGAGAEPGDKDSE
jgi:ribosome-binding factor A